MALAAGLLAGGGFVQAGTSYSGYDVIVPGFNSSAFTDNQTKKTSSASADLKVSILGKAMDARAQSHSGGTGGLGSYCNSWRPFQITKHY